jgi:N-acetyl-gamma-glutamyl-phosphate reductase
MIQAAVIGATGYAGNELVRLLRGHPHAQVAAVTSRSHPGQPYGDIFPNHNPTGLLCGPDDVEEAAGRADVIFLALPHGVAGARVTPALLEQAKVIDLGADFRLKDPAVYEAWYGVASTWRALLPEAVYGLCELNRPALGAARLVANPGCYTTCALLALYPLLKEGVIREDSVIIDAKSGVSGAGRGLELGLHFCEAHGSMKAYKVAGHRHTPEIEQELSRGAGAPVTVTFTPHLAPMNRGILATCYGQLQPGWGPDQVRKVYEKFYGDEFFIRLCPPGVFPETKWQTGANFCDIGFALDARANRLIVVAALDNLVKGAAGQAIQNMNILFGLPEAAGLEAPAMFP